VEGVASSVALVERLLQKQQQGKTATAAETNATTTTTDRSILSELSNDDEIWDHAANALASLCATLLLLLSVERIVLGGGILKRDGLLRKIQARTVVLLNGYLELPPPSVSYLSSKSNDDNGNDESIVTLEQLITTSVHGDNAGLQGAIVLAQRAYYQDRYRSAVATPAIKKDNDDDDDDDDDTRKDDNKKNDSFLAPDMKRQAFQIGWTFGMLVGAVGTALLMRYHGGAKRR
jgi:ROK family